MRSRAVPGVVLWMVAAAAWLSAGSAPAPQGVRPRLLVVLVVDQLRADYLTEYGAQWTKGLRRLLDRGAVFTDAAYPYAVTKTCAGHTTIGTGRLPASHGMIDNSWYDRAAERTVVCTHDPGAVALPFAGGLARGSHGPALMIGPTLADELRRQTGGSARVVTMSLKARSAIGLAGHAGPGVTVVWKDDNAAWSTSTAYTPAPYADVEAFVAAHPVEAAYGQTWTPLLPEASYKYRDDEKTEGRNPVFPHVIDGNNALPDSTFHEEWERSPLSDAYLGRLAQHLIQRQQLGQRDAIDYLGVSFSALDLVGHIHGPKSHEVQDVLVRLDAVVGELLDRLDAVVGPTRYVVALTSDHGVASIPEMERAGGADAGRVSTGAVRQAVDAALDEAIAPATWVANVTSPYLYFVGGRAERVNLTPGAREAVARAMLSIPGIARVVWPDELREAAGADPVLLALRHSYVAGRSGDVAFVVKPNWLPQSSGTTHGSAHPYDRRVPLILAGFGIARGTHATAATPADIAPTFARLAGLTLTGVDGRVLVESLAVPPTGGGRLR